MDELAKNEWDPTQKTCEKAAETVVEVADAAALEAAELLANNHPNPNVQAQSHLALLVARCWHHAMDYRKDYDRDPSEAVPSYSLDPNFLIADAYTVLHILEQAEVALAVHCFPWTILAVPSFHNVPTTYIANGDLHSWYDNGSDRSRDSDGSLGEERPCFLGYSCVQADNSLPAVEGFPDFRHVRNFPDC